MKAILITRTNWNEVPRIRHDLTNLLLENNINVDFVQKPSRIKEDLQNIIQNKNLRLLKSFEKFHPQFSFHRFLSRFYLQSFKLPTSNLQKHYDFAINFNAFFNWKQLEKITTVKINLWNDNFERLSYPWSRKETKKNWDQAIRDADLNLCVSKELVGLCRRQNINSHLFLPWAPNTEFSIKPNKFDSEKKLLFFGVVNNRINWELVKKLLEKGVKIDFIGPNKLIPFDSRRIINPNNSESLSPRLRRSLEKHGASFMKEINLEELSRIAGGYYAAFLPWKKNRVMDQVTLNNKVLKLLKIGLPIIYQYNPNLLEAPSNIIWKAKNIDDYLEAITFFKDSLNRQNTLESIQTFLQKHSSEQRFKEFKKLAVKL